MGLRNTINFHLQVFVYIFKCGSTEFDKVRPSRDWLKFADEEWSDIAFGKNVCAKAIIVENKAS